MARTLYLHAGLHKTGTSSVQSHLMRPGGPLDQAGIDWLPAAVAPEGAHHNAAWEAAGHRRHRPGLPGLDALIAAAEASPADRLFVSSEDFCPLRPAPLARLAERLRPFDVRPILVVRNPLDLAESLFAQGAKRGRSASVQDFVERLVRTGRLDFDRVLDRWDAAFGPGSLVSLVYEDHADVVAAVAGLLGLPPGRRPPARRNRSLNERFTDASRRLAARLLAGEPGLADLRALAASPDRLARACLAAAGGHPRFAGHPVFLSRAEGQALLDRLRPRTEALAARVALPPSYLRIPADRREPERATAEDDAALLDGLRRLAAAA